MKQIWIWYKGHDEKKENKIFIFFQDYGIKIRNRNYFKLIIVVLKWSITKNMHKLINNSGVVDIYRIFDRVMNVEKKIN